jgi:hypothetical protein
MKDYKTIWKQLANEKKLTSEHFIQRAILIAMNCKRNAPKEDIVHSLLQKYFTQTINDTKLINGQHRWYRLYWTLSSMRFLFTRGKVNIFDDPTLLDTIEEQKEFADLLKSIDLDKLNRHYVYYFTIQKDLSPEQQGVQAGHVLFKLGTEISLKEISPALSADGVYFQWIGVEDTFELRKVMAKHKDIKFSTFFEPDVGKMTSVAFQPILWNKRSEFLDYPLLVH